MRTFLLALFYFAFANSVWAECSLKLRVNDSPPYYYLEGNEYKGLYVEQAQLLADLVGCQITTINAPWGRSLRSLKDGKIDMMPNLSITEEREEYLHFLGPHNFEDIVLVVPEESNYQINSLTDLLKLPGKIGVERDAYYGHSFHQLLDQQENQDKWVWYTAEGQYSLEERVRLGRLAGFLDVAKPQYDVEGVKYHAFIINSSPVFFGFSKKSVSEELFNKLHAAFDSKVKKQFETLSKEYK